MGRTEVIGAKPCTAVTLSSTNSTWSGLEVKLHLHGERRRHSWPMSYFMAYLLC